MVTKRLLLLSAILALAVGALVYFLFVVRAPEAQRTASDSPASAAAPAPRFAAAPLPEPAADETDLCGYGRVKESDVENVRDQSAKDADEVLDGLKKKLAASKDPRQAALGLYMLGSKEALVKLASGSRDPQVYALAFLSCGYTGGGACDLLSAQQWAEMDSDNGVPWLLVASAARPRFVPQGDPERNVAMYQAVVRASSAKRFDSYLPDFLGMLQRPQILDQPPQTRSALDDVLMGMQMALPMISYAPFIEYCRDATVDGVTRASVCTNLANVLLGDRTMLGFSAGVRLAESAGWSPDRVGALQKQRTEYQGALGEPHPKYRENESVRSDCDGLAAFDRWAAEYSRLGDRGMAEKSIEETRKANAVHGDRAVP